MTVYEQALTDARKYVEVAEERATEKLLAATLPRIRRLIESEVIGAGDDDLDVDVQMTEPDASGNVTLNVTPAVTADMQVARPEPTPQPVIPTIPAPPSPSIPSADVIDSSGEILDGVDDASMEDDVTSAVAEAKMMLGARISKRSPAYAERLQELKAHMTDMYTQINAGGADDSATRRLSEALERSLAQLAVGEIGMKRIRENDISLKLTGMPEDIDLQDVGVEIESDGEDGGEQSSDTNDDEGGDDSNQDDSDSGDELDFGGDDDGGSDDDDDDNKHEAEEPLRDDDVIEIDEAEIKAEIARLRSVREAEARPDNRGHGAGHLDAFGDGRAEGDPLDVDIVTERNVSKLRALKTRALREGKLKTYRECKARIATLTRNSAAPGRRIPARGAVTQSTRVNESSELAKANVTNAQLAYANKLLLRNDISAAQKRQVMERLSKAGTVREVKMIFESVIDLLNSSQKLNENRGARRMSASSRTVGSGSSTTINEGVSAARWSVLAGLAR